MEQSRENQIGQLVARAWAEEDFKQRLLSNPMAVLKEEGITVPEGLQIKVVENSDTVFHFILPQRPVNNELSDAQLAAVTGGDGWCELTCKDYACAPKG